VRSAVLFLLAGCAAQPLPNAAPTGIPAGVPDLKAEVRGPSRVTYDPIGLGVGAHEVVVTLANPGAATAVIGDVRVAYAAQRNGIAVPCEERKAVRQREPRTIAPGARASYVRTLDCSMPLPGNYDVHVLASWAGESLHEIGSFGVDVVDTAGRGPKPIIGREGLSAAIAGAQLVNPTTGWEATIAVLNESAKIHPLGSIRVVLRSHPVGKELWCISPPNDIRAPDVLAPGKMHVVRARLACNLEEPGTYVVFAQLVLDGSSEPTDIGEMQVRVTRDSIELTPLSPPLP